MRDKKRNGWTHPAGERVEIGKSCANQSPFLHTFKNV